MTRQAQILRVKRELVADSIERKRLVEKLVALIRADEREKVYQLDRKLVQVER